nr:ATP-grasp domain-containing protein [Bacillus sp. FJAT-50079]
MKTIIFIGTNKSGSSREAIKAAERLGYFTVVFTNNEKQLQQREEYIEVHEMIFIKNHHLSDMKKEVQKLQLQGKDIKTIVSFIDSQVHIATALCEEFCPNNISSESIYIMENKDETRVFLSDQPYTPKFIIVTPDVPIHYRMIKTMLTYPVMVKAPKSTGSKDVLFAEDEKQLKRHIQVLREKNPDDTIIIEEYVEGEQYLVEALIYNNKLLIAGIIKQEITHGRRFIVTGYGVLAHVPPTIQRDIEEILQSIIEKFGLEKAALHLELRWTRHGWRLIEINPRISGGAMNNMLQAAFGFNLVEETLKLFLGEQPQLQVTSNHYVFTKYIILAKKGILEKVTGRGRARKSPGVVEVYVKPKKGTKLTPPLSMGHRYAYVMAAGSTMNEAREFANAAAKEITFHLQEE